MNPSFAQNLKIVFYDNRCMLCHWSVRFIVKHDKKEQFAFAPLQGSTWRQLSAIQVTPALMESVQYFDGKTLTDKSDAALLILCQMGDGWQLFSVFKIIPLTWRNAVYDFIAHNRHKWFSRPIECSLENQFPAGRILD